MFKDTDYILHSFLLCNYLVYTFFLLYVTIFHLFRGWEGVGIHCEFIPKRIEATPAMIQLK